MVSVAVLSDAPTLTTGFGRTTAHIAEALARAGHPVNAFGLKARREDVEGVELPYRIYPAELRGHWTESLPDFFATARPDVLLLNMDAYNALECVEACAAAGWHGPTVSYVCFDGLPVAEPYLDVQRGCADVWTTAPGGRRYLECNGVRVAGCAPAGVDRLVFRPHPDREALLRRAGLEGIRLIGAFATNTRRKQLARVVAGFALACELPTGSDLRLYLHCAPEGAWDLRAVAEEHGVSDRVIFPTDDGYDEPRGLAALEYVDRMNACAAIVNVPDSGDTEQVIFEAQACGVPLLHTDDEGIMSETFGDGALPLPGKIEVGPIGQRLNLVAPETIAAGLARVLGDDALRASLVAAGRGNAERHGWDVLESAAPRMVAPFAERRAG